MPTHPLVTVVVPTKDVGRTLERCLASIRAQSWPSVELVVIDNFSSDDTFATVIVVSEDGPVTVFRGGEIVGRSERD